MDPAATAKPVGTYIQYDTQMYRTQLGPYRAVHTTGYTLYSTQMYRTHRTLKSSPFLLTNSDAAVCTEKLLEGCALGVTVIR